MKKEHSVDSENMFQFEENECASDHYASDYRPFAPSVGISSGRSSLGAISSGGESNTPQLLLYQQMNPP